MNKQKHTRAWELGRALPSLNFCTITTTERGSWAETLVLTKEKQKNADLERLCVQKTERWAAFRGLSFEAKALASVCASLARASFNLLCKRVVCRVEGIQFPLTCCFIPQSHFFFLVLLSPLHLHNPPKRFLARSARKNSFWKWTFFFWCEHRRVQRWKCLTSLPYFWGTRTKVHSGVIVEWGSGVLGQRGDVGFRRNREILVSSPPAHTWPRIMGHLIPDVPRGLMPHSPRYWATRTQKCVCVPMQQGTIFKKTEGRWEKWNSHSTHTVTSYMCEMAAFHYGLHCN